MAALNLAVNAIHASLGPRDSARPAISRFWGEIVVDIARGEDIRPKRYLSWNEYEQLTARLVELIKEGISEEIDIVFGIFRGGIILARSLVSRFGEVPLAILHPKKTTDSFLDCLANEDMNQLSYEKRRGMNVLLVDDISDSGETFMEMKHCLEAFQFKNVYSAALIYKIHSRFVPDFFGELDSTMTWVIFPWEKVE
jgi:hypoxanthine phosphoribosyltransferase